jgi:hypothetical protein
MPHLTEAIIKRLARPATGNKLYRDDVVTGFAARVTAAGARSYVLNYTTKAGRERRITIGDCGDWAATAPAFIPRPASPLGSTVGCSLSDLTVLSAQVDPYRLDTPSGHRDGQWVAEHLNRLVGGTKRIHWRGLHYVLVTPGNLIKPKSL